MLRLYSRALVVADDLTGCCDTALQFSRAGYKVAVVPDYRLVGSSVEGCDVIALNTNTRAVRPAEAYERICEVLRDSLWSGYLSGDVLVYKKVDSTLRGNIAEEVKAVYDVLKPDLIVFAPAYPKQGRTTSKGIHMVRGVPVDKTYFGSDPVSPAKSSYIPSYFEKEFSGSYRHLFVDELRSRAGAGGVRGYRLVSSDIEVSEDFRRLIELVLGSGSERVVWVGSAGLAEHLMDYVVILSRPGRVVLMCLGSPNDMLRRQVSRMLSQLEGVALVHLNVERLLRAYEVELNRVLNEVSVCLGKGSKVVVVASAYLEEEVARGRMLAKEMEIDEASARYLIADSIGRLCASITNDLADRLGGLVLCGGDVALAAFRHLRIRSCEVVSEVESGFPILKVAGVQFRIATKAGGFGDEWTLMRAAYRLSS